MLMQHRLLLVLSLTTAVAASRVQPTSSLQKHKGTSAAKSWSPWEVHYDGLTCAALESLPWEGLKTNWPKCWAEAVKAAAELSKKGNCKLCDVSFAGSKPDSMQGWTSTGCTAAVTCAGIRLGKPGCNQGNGEVTEVTGLNDGSDARAKSPELACMPCPAGCKQCHIVYSRITGTHRQFKCVVKPVGTPVKDGGEGEKCVTPQGFNCGSCQKRTCSGIYWFGCSTDDYKSTCDFPSTFEPDFVNPEAVVTAGPEDYTITLKAGEDKTALPPVLEYLSKAIGKDQK